MKHLQRLELPAGVNIGRGVRMTYSAEHLLQLAVAFEVIGTGLAAKAATDLVNQFWDRFQAAFGRAHKRLSYSSEPETFVCLAGRPPVEAERSFLDEVTVHDLPSLSETVLAVDALNTPMRAGMILIRADYILERIKRLARDVGQVSNAKWSPEYNLWSGSRDTSQQLWDYADGGSKVPF